MLCILSNASDIQAMSSIQVTTTFAEVFLLSSVPPSFFLHLPIAMSRMINFAAVSCGLFILITYILEISFIISTSRGNLLTSNWRRHLYRTLHFPLHLFTSSWAISKGAFSNVIIIIISDSNAQNQSRHL
jgi:hypothetical protein